MIILSYYRRTNVAYAFHLVLSLLCLSDSIFTSDVCRGSVYCFECNSKDTPECGDPFNRSLAYSVPLNRCQGCCIKLVRWKNTPDEVVYRMCSANQKLEIDHSLIDHVCLAEWKDGGTMCFCEHDRCNGAVNHRRPATVADPFCLHYLSTPLYTVLLLINTRIFGY